MAQKGIFRAGTETPQGLDGHPVSDQAYQRTLDGMKNAYQNKVLMTFSTDADYWVQGKTRGEQGISGEMLGGERGNYVSAA